MTSTAPNSTRTSASTSGSAATSAPSSQADRPAWRDEIAARRAEEARLSAAGEAADPAVLTPRRLFDALNEVKDRDTIIVTDVGQHQMWAAQYTDFERVRRFASSGGLGTMGYGMGAAIGARIATGDRTVLITGDGSFGMNLNEMATLVRYGIPVVIVIMNNGVLGMVRQWQTLFFGKRYSRTVLGGTDFVRLAEAFGMRGERVATPADFRAAFARAMESGEPYLIDAVIDKDEFVLPMLKPGGSIEDIIPSKAEASK